MTTPHSNARNTPEAIGRAIAKFPDGPIILWYYPSTTSEYHRHNRAILNDTCEGPGNGILELCGSYWKLVNRSAEGGGGFAMLEKLPPAQTAAIVARKMVRKNYKAWWRAQCIALGFMEASPDERGGYIEPTP